MARRSEQSDPALLRKKLADLLENFSSELSAGDLRKKVLKLVPAFHLLRDLGSSLISEDIPAGMERIIFYLKKYPQKIIKGDELMVVSGIGEWARRVRQLRVEFGWSIISGVTAKEMAVAEEGGDIEIDGRNLAKIKTDEYVLLDVSQDRDAAFRWKTANTIRKRKNVSIQGRILEFLLSNIGKPVTGEELRYVSNNKSEWARRVRELRTEEGWPVWTRSSGRPELPVGVYILEENRQAEPHDRKIEDVDRCAVLERDNYKCRKCGWDYEHRHPADPRQRLELHHMLYHAKKGANTADNLIALCNVCHDAIHARKVDIEEFLSTK